MKILLTGSEGFIGSHLTEKLVKLGHKVKCTVLYNSFNNYKFEEIFLSLIPSAKPFPVGSM